MHKNILITLLTITCIVQVWAIARLAPDEPSKGPCIPLYGDTGYECCQR